MRSTLLLASIASFVCTAALAADHAETGYRTDTTLIDAGDGGCGTRLLNSDGTYENGYAWRYGAHTPPDYGAFAECYFGADLELCSAFYDFTTTGTQDGQSMDIFVYADRSDAPGPVICGPIRVTPGPVALWPAVSRHTFALDGCPPCTPDAWWVAYWGNWPGEVQGWFIGADLDGFGGCPFTNLVISKYGSGWNNVSLVWGPTQALGIGCEVIECTPTPVQDGSWGRIKALYQ